MKLNPLNTLAGRLILVTIAAIAISHIVAFTLFANERVRTVRRVTEQNVVERVVAEYDRLRTLSAEQQATQATASSDFGLRYSITSEPVATPTIGDAAGIARTVSDQLDGVQARARERTIEVNWPSRFRVPRGENRRPPPDDPNAPPDAGERMRRPPPTFQREAGPPDEDPPRRQVTELTVDVALAPQRWLRARALLPTPRPAPPSFWYAAIASILAVSVGAVLIARQIGKPLAHLAVAAERLGRGDTNVHAPVSGPEDVRGASTAFNAMADRLGRQLSRQRQMLWALSHDLRTPITALKLRAELIEDDAARQRLLAPLSEMETLTEQALSLARAGASEEKRTPVDLAEIARTLSGELNDLGIETQVEAASPIIAECRPSEIARAMRNLAENASKHGGGGTIKVYRNADGAAVVEVADNGPGLAPDMVARVTEPFFRADAARSGDNGAGLGLAIVQAIADGHGGRLVLENRAPHGLSAKLILPAA